MTLCSKKSHTLSIQLKVVEDAYNRHCFDEQARIQRSTYAEVLEVKTLILRLRRGETLP